MEYMQNLAFEILSNPGETSQGKKDLKQSNSRPTYSSLDDSRITDTFKYEGKEIDIIYLYTTVIPETLNWVKQWTISQNVLNQGALNRLTYRMCPKLRTYDCQEIEMCQIL